MLILIIGMGASIFNHERPSGCLTLARASGNQGLDLLRKGGIMVHTMETCPCLCFSPHSTVPLRFPHTPSLLGGLYDPLRPHPRHAALAAALGLTSNSCLHGKQPRRSMGHPTWRSLSSRSTGLGDRGNVSAGYHHLEAATIVRDPAFAYGQCGRVGQGCRPFRIDMTCTRTNNDFRSPGPCS